MFESKEWSFLKTFCFCLVLVFLTFGAPSIHYLFNNVSLPIAPDPAVVALWDPMRGEQEVQKAGEFEQCLEICLKQLKCGSNEWNNKAPFYMKLLLWTCNEDCEYRCMQNFTSQRLLEGKKIVQYKGKWPLIRILGMQELFSVVASLLNLCGPIHALYTCHTKVPPCFLKNIILAVSVTGICAWIASAVFHARDFKFTERADYYFADMYAFTLSSFSIVRMWKLSPIASWMLFSWNAFLYLNHLRYMQFVLFDYGYNTLVATCHFLVITVVWVYFSVKNWKKKPYAWKIVPTFCSTWIGAMMEVFDFAPVMMLVDAHAIWHFSTVPMNFFFTGIIIEDAMWCWKRANKKHEL